MSTDLFSPATGSVSPFKSQLSSATRESRGLVGMGGVLKHKPQATHLDLFSGIGGFAIAASLAGFKTVGFCENNIYAQKILIKNFHAIMADPNGDRCSWCDEVCRRDLEKSEKEEKRR